MTHDENTSKDELNFLDLKIEIEDIPADFQKVFDENFWEILA